ncbi:MAG: histidine phosphatase family protein [Cyanobacteria bacterium P01_D01_bin.156]
MILTRDKLIGTIGILLFALGSCGSVSQPSNPPTTTSAPVTESTPAEITPEPETQPEAPETIAVSEGDIWSRLRQADTHYYVLMRHAIAPGTGDPSNFQLDDCATQRNLSQEGIAQAQRTGDAFKENRVTVQRVLSSEWCRCLDTGTAMDVAPVEPFPPLNSFFSDRSTEPEQTAAVREFMINNRDEPGVTVLITHFVNIGAIADSGVASGEIVVMQVNDQNEPEVIETIAPF